MILSYYHLVPLRKVLLQAHHDKWLSCYLFIFAILTYLTMVKKCITIFFSKNDVSLETSPLNEARKRIKKNVKNANG